MRNNGWKRILRACAPKKFRHSKSCVCCPELRCRDDWVAFSQRQQVLITGALPPSSHGVAPTAATRVAKVVHCPSADKRARARSSSMAASISATPTASGTFAKPLSMRWQSASKRPCMRRMRSNKRASTNAATGLPSLLMTTLSCRYCT